MAENFLYVSVINSNLTGGGGGGVTNNYYTTIVSGGTTQIGGTTNVSNYNTTVTGGTTNISGPAISAGTNSQNSGTVIFGGGTGGNVTFGLDTAGNLTATAPGGTAPVGAGTNGAITGGSMTVNTSGISISIPAYLTTAQPPGAYLTTAAQVSHTHGGISLSLSNISGTYSSASNGLTLSLTGATGGTGGAGGAAISASGGSQNSGTVVFANSNNVSFGFSGGSVTATVTGLVSDLTVSNLTISSTAGSLTIYGPALIAGSNITFSTSGNSITINGASGGTGGGGAGAAPGISTAGNTAGNTGTFSTGTYLFEGSNYLTVSQITGTNSVHTLRLVPAVSVLTAGANITLSSAGNTISIIGAAGGTAGGTWAGTAGAITGGSITVNTSGISVNLPAYLTGFTQTTNQIATVYGTSNTVGASSGTINLSSIVMRGVDQLSVGVSNGTLIFEHGGADPLFNRIAASNSTAPAGSTVVFSNSNNVTFGITNGSQVTASASFNQSVQPAAGTNTGVTGSISLTVNTSGVSVSIPAFLTTAQPVGAYLTTAALSGDTSKYAGTVTGITGSIGLTANTSGVSVSIPAFLTTAAQSGHTHGSAPSITGSIGVTSNSSAWSISIPAFLTTAALSGDTSKYAGTVTGATGSISITANTSGVSVSIPAFLTTAAPSTHTHGSAPSITGSIGVTSNSSAWSISIPAFLTTAQSPGAYLTTAMLSNASSVFAGVGTSATNASITLNTAGLAISVAAPGAGGGAAIQGSGTYSQSTGTVQFQNSNGVTFGLSNNGVMTASIAPGAAAGIGAIAGGTQTQTSGTLSFSNNSMVSFAMTNSSQISASIPMSQLAAGNGIVLSSNGSTISIIESEFYTGYDPYHNVVSQAVQYGQSTMHVWPVDLPDIVYSYIGIPLIYSNASNSSNSQTISLSFALYTRNSQSFGTIHSTSYTTAMSASGSVGTNYAAFGGNRELRLPWTSTISYGRYYQAFLSKTASNAGGCSISNVGRSNWASAYSGPFGVASNASNQWYEAAGIFSAQTAAIPVTFNASDIVGSTSVQMRPQIWRVMQHTY